MNFTRMFYIFPFLGRGEELMMKRLVVLLMVLALGFSFGGCFKKKENAEPPKKPEKTQSEEAKKVKIQEKKEIPYTESRWGKMHQDYLTNGEILFQGSSDVGDVAFGAKGQMLYGRTFDEDKEQYVDQIANPQTLWELDVENMTYETFEVEAYEESKETFFNIFSVPQDKFNQVKVTVGTTKYDGKSYDYEEFSYDGEKQKNLYDGDKLVLIIYSYDDGSELRYEDIEITTTVDDVLFEVPDDYQAI